MLNSSSISKQPSHSHIKSAKVIKGTKGNWILTKTIGKGSMGKVKLAINETTKEKRACKIISATKLQQTPIGPTTSIRDIPAANHYKNLQQDQAKEFRIIREAAIMLLLDHPYIVTLHEILLIDQYYYFVFDLVSDGQMLDFIISHGKLKEKVARKYLRQIVSAVDYCHQNSIVHRDLKIENILIDKEGSIQLIDFGLSNLYQPNSQLSTFCGSLYFAAPELLAARSYIGPEIDIWSLGIILFVLVCGKVPFDDTSMPVLHTLIKNAVVDYPPFLSTECKTLISQMLNPNPALRCTMEDIKNSSWMTKGYDGPPDNYVPVRQHLELPLNLEVIKRMKGFGFGTDEEIKCKLEDIIQKRNLLKQQQSTFHNEKESKNNFFRKENFSAQKFDLKGVGRALNKSKSEKWKPGLPEYSIVSIYYLVQEKMEKDISSGRISVVEKKENQVVEDNNGATRQNNEDIMTDLEGRSSVESKLIQNEEVENAIPLSSDNEESINALSAPTSPRLSRKDIIFIDEQPVKKRRSRPRAASMGELAIPNSMKSFKEIKDFVGRKKKKRLSKKVITEAESESDLGDSERVEKDLENTSPLEANLSESENDIFGSSSNTEGLGAGLGEKKKIASHLVSAVKKKMSQFGNRNQRNSSSNKEDLLDRETVSENEVESLSPSTVPFQKSNTIGTGPRNSRLSRNRNEFGNNPKRHQNHFNKEVSGTLVEDISSVKEEKLHRMKKRRSLGNQFQSSKSFFQGDDIKFNKNDIHDLEIEIVTPASSPANPTLPTSVIHIAGDVTDKSHYKKKERVDSNVKKVFMKGLFSVLTSSTKPTSFIRKDLIRVFQFLNVEFHESDGVFECRYIIDLKKNLPNSPAEEKSNVASKEDKEKAEKKLEITDDLDLFHVGSEEECDQATSSCVNNGNSNIKRVSAAQQQVPSSPQDKPPKLPKFPSASNLKQKIQQQKLEHQNDVILTSAEAEILKVNENIENLQPDKLKSIETENASINNNRNFLIPMNIKTFNSTTVFFEVFIVKIGWIGLHGVRFRRIEGNIWQVKRNYLFEIY